jgi:hypothetical protein
MRLYKGEIQPVGVTVYHRDGEAFTINSATFSVKEDGGSTVLASGAAVVDGHEVSASVDTTPSGYVAGHVYIATFSSTITDSSALVIGKVRIDLKE